MHTLKTQTKPLVPLVIKVMDLQRVLLMEEHKTLFASKWNWADAYVCATLGEASPNYHFLRQALLALHPSTRGARGRCAGRSEVRLRPGFALVNRCVR